VVESILPVKSSAARAVAGESARADEARGMPIPVDVQQSRAFSGTPRRIYQLLAEMGTSGDAIWPFAAQPFMRTSGPLTVGTTEEWHLGVHSILAEAVPEERIVWRIDNDGVVGTHGFFLTQEGKKTVVMHQFTAELSDPEGRMFWKRLADAHERAIDGLFDKLARVLKR
jgi:hypothetical protein